MMPTDNPLVVGSVEFQLSHDLKISTVIVGDTMEVFALTGGCFVFLYAIFAIIFSLGVEWLMNLEIVKNLFKVDPTYGKKSKSIVKMKQTDPA